MDLCGPGTHFWLTLRYRKIVPGQVQSHSDFAQDRHQEHVNLGHEDTEVDQPVDPPVDLHEETDLVRVRLVHVFQGTRLVLDVQGQPRLEHGILGTPDNCVDDQVHEKSQVLAGRVHSDPKNRQVGTRTRAVPGARGVLWGHPDTDKKDTEPRGGEARHVDGLHLH